MSERAELGPLNALTVDVEEHFQVSAFESCVGREAWETIPSRVSGNTDRLLDLFDETGVRATFFVLGWVAARHPGLVRRIAERGHELASHGWSHRLIHDQSPADFRDELEQSKRLLEDLGGHAVEGHRAASFSIGPRNLWALDVVAECGFSYDSSLFPVVHDRYGFPGAPRGIYRLATPSGATLVEVPPSTVAIAGLTLPVAGGGYLRLYPSFVTGWAVKRLNRRERRPAVIYLHPWEVDPEQPRVAHIPWAGRFRHYVNLHTTARKVRELVRRHRFGPMREVIAAAGELPRVELGPPAAARAAR